LRGAPVKGEKGGENKRSPTVRNNVPEHLETRRARRREKSAPRGQTKNGTQKLEKNIKNKEKTGPLQRKETKPWESVGNGGQ